MWKTRTSYLIITRGQESLSGGVCTWSINRTKDGINYSSKRGYVAESDELGRRKEKEDEGRRGKVRNEKRGREGEERGGERRRWEGWRDGGGGDARRTESPWVWQLDGNRKQSRGVRREDFWSESHGSIKQALVSKLRIGELLMYWKQGGVVIRFAVKKDLESDWRSYGISWLFQ